LKLLISPNLYAALSVDEVKGAHKNVPLEDGHFLVVYLI